VIMWLLLKSELSGCRFCCSFSYQTTM
jgi:hypothetical protein